MTGIFPTPAGVEAELEDLRRQRRAIEDAIAERQLFLDLGRRLASGPATGPVPSPDRAPAREPPPSQERRPAPTLAFPGLTPVSVARAMGRRLVDEAFAILAEEGRPMHAAEILAILTQRGFTLPGSDPVAALNTRLWKRARGDGPLVRHGDAVYGLRPAPAAR